MRATTDSGQAITLRRPEIVFSRVLVGVDGSAESYEAGRQAGLFLEDEGELTLLVAYDIASAPVGGTGVGVPAYLDEDLQRERAGPVPALVAAADADSLSSAAGACTASSRWARSRSGSLTRRARRY
jgi:hypothetical protein